MKELDFFHKWQLVCEENNEILVKAWNNKFTESVLGRKNF